MSNWIIDATSILPLPVPTVMAAVLDRQAYTALLHAANIWTTVSQTHPATVDMSLDPGDLGIEVKLIEVTAAITEHLKRSRAERTPEGVPGVISQVDLTNTRSSALSVRLLVSDSGLRFVATYNATPPPAGSEMWDLTPEDFGAVGPIDVTTTPTAWPALIDMCRAHRPIQESQ